jgi:hypothetical protein
MEFVQVILAMEAALTIAQNEEAEEIKNSAMAYYIGEEMMGNIANALQVWTRAKSFPFSDSSIHNIVYGNGRFVTAGDYTSTLAYSDDGDTWVSVPNVFRSRNSNVRGLAYGNGRFVAAINGEDMAYSQDGIAWTLAENGGLGDYSIYGIAYGAGCFVAVGYDRHQRKGIIGYSRDGQRWTLVEDGSLDIDLFNCISYGNGIFIAGGEDGKAAYSNNGITWKIIPGSPFEDRNVRIIAYGNGRFVVFCSYFQGYNPMILYSDNGMDWFEISDEGPFDPIYNIVYGNGTFIAVSHSARMTYSFDGITWHKKSNGGVINALAGPGDNLGGIAYGNGRFVIGGGINYGNNSRIAWCDVPVLGVRNE